MENNSMEIKNHIYDATVQGVMNWANSELEHVGRIVSIKDEDIQYSYAQSTVYGMAHLKDALAQLVGETEHEDTKRDLLRIHDKVIRVMKHLIKDFSIDLEAIKIFNSRKVLSNLSYLNVEGGKRRSKNKTRKYKKGKITKRN